MNGRYLVWFTFASGQVSKKAAEFARRDSAIRHGEEWRAKRGWGFTVIDTNGLDASGKRGAVIIARG